MGSGLEVVGTGTGGGRGRGEGSLCFWESRVDLAQWDGCHLCAWAAAGPKHRGLFQTTGWQACVGPSLARPWPLQKVM